MPEGLSNPATQPSLRLQMQKQRTAQLESTWLAGEGIHANLANLAVNVEVAQRHLELHACGIRVTEFYALCGCMNATGWREEGMH